MQDVVVQHGSNAASDTEGDNVMPCMVVGGKVFVYILGNDQFNGILTGMVVFHWQSSLLSILINNVRPSRTGHPVWEQVFFLVP